MNGIIRKLTFAAAALALLAFASHEFARPVLAQVRAALTQNLDEPGRNPYQENHVADSTNCAGGGKQCIFFFSEVPVGKRLVLTHVSGYVNIVDGVLPSCNIQSSVSGSQAAAAFFTGVRSNISSISNTIFVNQDLQMYFGPGESPYGYCGLANSTDTFTGAGRMTLSGYYISNP